jgi:glycosyltransferase involved in cell wall biosynthesis
MRKGIVLSTLFPNPQEPMRAPFIWQETQSLHKRYDLRVIAPVPYVPPFLKSRPRYAFHAVPQEETRAGLVVHHPRYLVTPGMLRSAYGHLMYWGILPLFKRLCREARPDFLVAHFAFPDGYAAALLARREKIPLLIKARGSDLHLFTRSRLRRHMTLSALRQADRAVVVSEAMSEHLASLGFPADRIVIMPNGVDRERFHPRDRDACRRALGLEPGAYTFVFVGQLRPIKGLSTLIDAFAGLGETARARARLLIVGDGELREVLARTVRTRGLESCVRLVGPLPHEDVPQWIGACDCLVLPSLTEGYPNVLVEALASGRPVIASRVGGIPEIVTDGRNGLLVPPGEAAPLRLAMERMLGGFSLPAKEAAKTPRSWDDVAGDMAALIEAMLSEGRGGKR